MEKWARGESAYQKKKIKTKKAKVKKPLNEAKHETTLERKSQSGFAMQTARREFDTEALIRKGGLLHLKTCPGES